MDIREALAEDIQKVLAAGDGWDGPGSVGTTSERVKRLLAILDQMQLSPSLLPKLVLTRVGGICAEWHFGENSLEIEIAGDSVVVLAAQIDGGVPRDLPEAAKLLAVLYAAIAQTSKR